MPGWRDAGLAGLVTLGAWVSFHYGYPAWNVESDLATPAMVWTEWGRHGWAALQEWRYYHANWLFSVILSFFAVFSALGSAPGVVLATGWGIFAGCCLATWWILRPTLGGRAATAAAGLLLFAGHATISGMGYLTYAVSHNASTLFSLAALACLLGWLDKGRLWRLLIASVLMFAGAMSDSWTVAALGVPLLLAAGLTWALGHRAAWKRLLAICACTAAVLVLVQTRVFGLLIVLPRSQYVFGTLDTAREHAWLAAQYAAVLFNAFPGADAPWSYVPHLPAMAGTCGILLLVVGYSVVRAVRLRRVLTTRELFLAAVAASSAAVLLTAFVLSDVPADLGTGRYFVILYFLLPALVLSTMRPGIGRLAPWVAQGGLVWCGLFMLTGLLSAPRDWLRLWPETKDAQVRGLAEFLEANGLAYGYGGFWGAQANAIGWVSVGRVVVRPVVAADGRIVPRFAQTFAWWYEAEDVPVGQDGFFFVAAPDAELCPDAASCVALAERQWGRADRALQYGDVPVLVWRRPLVTGMPAAEVVTRAPALAEGKAVGFRRGESGDGMLWQGWSAAESAGTWSDGRRAVMLAHLPAGWRGPAVLELEMSGYPAEGRGRQRVSVRAGGATIAEWSVEPGEFHRYRATLPETAAADGLASIELDLPDAVIPARRNGGPERRRLGVNLRSVMLLP